MALFKILTSEDSRQVMFKGLFSEYPDYNKLKRKIIELSEIKLIQLKFKEGDNFKLVFLPDPRKDLYIPSELKDGIGDNKSYSFFLEKLLLKGIGNERYKFYIKKTKRPFKFKKKENREYLKEALDSSWQPIYKNIIQEVGFSKLEESQVKYTKLKEELKKMKKR